MCPFLWNSLYLILSKGDDLVVSESTLWSYTFTDDTIVEWAQHTKLLALIRQWSFTIEYVRWFSEPLFFVKTVQSWKFRKTQGKLKKGVDINKFSAVRMTTFRYKVDWRSANNLLIIIIIVPTLITITLKNCQNKIFESYQFWKTTNCRKTS